MTDPAPCPWCDRKHQRADCPNKEFMVLFAGGGAWYDNEELDSMELNPHHPTVVSLRDQWHKVLLVLMRQQGLDEFVITEADVHKLDELDGRMAIVAQELHGGLHIRIVSMTEGERLAREHGGLPT